MSFVMQASVLDGFAFDPFSFQQDGLTAPEVDVAVAVLRAHPDERRQPGRPGLH
jgi:hypothetical protein